MVISVQVGPPPFTHSSHNNTRDNLTDKGGCKRAIFAPLVISKDTLIFSFSNTWQGYAAALMAACSTITSLTLGELLKIRAGFACDTTKSRSQNARTVCSFGADFGAKLKKTRRSGPFGRCERGAK